MKSFKDFLIEAKENISHKLVDMKIINEMATVCSKSEKYGFIAQIYSRDHNPPHIHIFNTEGKELGQIYITEKRPNLKKDIIIYKGNVDIVIDNILKWAKGKSKLGIQNWNRAKQAWIDNHKDEDIKFE